VSRPGTTSSGKKPAGPGKSVKFNTTANNEDIEEVADHNPSELIQHEEIKDQDTINRENVEKTLKDIEEIKAQY